MNTRYILSLLAYNLTQLVISRLARISFAHCLEPLRSIHKSLNHLQLVQYLLHKKETQFQAKTMQQPKTLSSFTSSFHAHTQAHHYSSIFMWHTCPISQINYKFGVICGKDRNMIWYAAKKYKNINYKHHNIL